MPEINLSQLSTFEESSKLLNIIIETPRGSRIKMKYDEEIRAFRAEKPLPVGMIFPFAFGFLPSTKGEDGDPLDVLVLTEAELPLGTVVLGKLIAVMECEQTEEGESQRNDRLIAIPVDGKKHLVMQPQVNFDENLRQALADFFLKYNELQEKEFRVIGFHGPQTATEIVKNGMAAARNTKRAGHAA
jgi:inorganic pyrophosphatase